MNQKGFANLVLMGALIVLVAVGGYLLWHKKAEVPMPVVQPVVSSTPVPLTVTSANNIANWETYTDSSNGFTFQYPNGSYLSNLEDPEPILVGMVFPNNILPNTSLTGSYIEVRHPSSSTEQDCLDINYVNDSLGGGVGKHQQTNLVSNNIKWYSELPNSSPNHVEGSEFKSSVFDGYNSWHNNTCWNVEFYWGWDSGTAAENNTGGYGIVAPPSAPIPSQASMAAVEQSILETFKFTK